MYTGLAKQFVCNSYRFRRHTQQKKVDETMQGEAFVLVYAKMRNGCILPSEIGNEMNISSARIAAVLNSLESKGLITRKTDPNDRRRVPVELTQKGKALGEQYYHMILGVTTRMLSALGEHDARELVRITGRLADLTLIESTPMKGYNKNIRGLKEKM